MRRNIFTLTAIIAVSLAVTLSVNYFIFAWTPPDADPPGGTVPGLPASPWAFNGNEIYYDVDNVGIGNTDPTQTLDVTGNVRVRNLTNCDTIDTDANGNLSCGSDESGDVELYFGGMWGQPSAAYINPITGEKSCPAGYTDRKILGNSGVDYDVHLCVGSSDDVAKVAEFGGMWGEPEAAFTNPITGAKSCPAGYNQKTILGFAGTDYQLNFCYTTNLSNPVISSFGGAYGMNGGLIGFYPNPHTHGPDCAIGYNAAKVLGKINVDYSVWFCYK